MKYKQEIVDSVERDPRYSLEQNETTESAKAPEDQAEEASNVVESTASGSSVGEMAYDEKAEEADEKEKETPMAEEEPEATTEEESAPAFEEVEPKEKAGPEEGTAEESAADVAAEAAENITSEEAMEEEPEQMDVTETATPEESAAPANGLYHSNGRLWLFVCCLHLSVFLQ